MSPQQQLVYIGIAGYVLALDLGTGEEVWRAKLRTAQFTSVAVVGGFVLAGCQGEVWALDRATGEIAWHDKLRGLGTGLVSFAGQQVGTAQQSHDDMASAAAIVAASGVIAATSS